jgi:hypothetical protein
LQTAGLSHFLIFGVHCKHLSATASQSFDRSLPLPAVTLAHLFAPLPTTGRAASNLNKSLVENGEVKLEYCPTSKMVADMVTKALSRAKVVACVEIAGLLDLSGQ